MRTSEARRQFKRSKELFDSGRYAESLAMLTQLDAEHPNDRHLLFPMALCLARVGRVDEARSLCDRIIREFNYPQAMEFRRQLGEAPPTVASLTSTPNISVIPGIQPIDLGDLNGPVVKYTPPEPEPMWKTVASYAGVALGSLAVVLLVVFLIFSIKAQIGQGGEEAASDVPMAERIQELQDPTQLRGPVLTLILLAFLAQPALLFLVLASAGSLPYPEAWKSIGHVILVTLGLAVFRYFVGKLGCIGLILGIGVTCAFVKRTYQLENGQVAIWFIGSILINVAIVMLIVALVLTA